MVLTWRLYTTIEPRAWAPLSIRQVRPDQTRTTWDPRAATRSHQNGITFTSETELNIREACFVIPSYERPFSLRLYKVHPSPNPKLNTTLSSGYSREIVGCRSPSLMRGFEMSLQERTSRV